MYTDIMPLKLANSFWSPQCFLHCLSFFFCLSHFFPPSKSLSASLLQSAFSLSLFPCLSVDPVCYYLFFYLPSIHLTLWPCLRAHTHTLQTPPLRLDVCFLPFLSVFTTTTKVTIFCSMPKQPSESSWLLWYLAAIVIGSHYSWDLPLNPGYVIGLLSTAQAGLTPQTSMHLAMMQCYYVSTRTTSQYRLKKNTLNFSPSPQTPRAAAVTLRRRAALFATQLDSSPGQSVSCDTQKSFVTHGWTARHVTFLWPGVKSGHRADIKCTHKWARAHTQTHKTFLGSVVTSELAADSWWKMCHTHTRRSVTWGYDCQWGIKMQQTVCVIQRGCIDFDICWQRSLCFI